MIILYEDNHLIAAVKPAGMLSQGDETGDISILDEIKQYLKDKYKKPGNVFLGLLHRLDRPVSGIMLFAKTSKGASRLSEQFRNRQVEKTYHALVQGVPKENLPAGRQGRGVLVNILGKDERGMRATQQKKGEESVLHYEVIKSNNTYALLKITIEGGKFHQIRAQLSMAGFPIVGDVKYGGSKWGDSHSIALSATGLSFITATTDEKIALSNAIPVEWNEYMA